MQHISSTPICYRCLTHAKHIPYILRIVLFGLKMFHKEEEFWQLVETRRQHKLNKKINKTIFSFILVVLISAFHNMVSYLIFYLTDTGFDFSFT